MHSGYRTVPSLAQRRPLRAGDHDYRRIVLHHLPERVLGQFLERAFGAVAVAALTQPVLDLQLEALRPLADGAGGAEAPAERATHKGVERDGSEPLRDGRNLLGAALVEVQAGRLPASTGPVMWGQAMADEDDGAHSHIVERSEQQVTVSARHMTKRS